MKDFEYLKFLNDTRLKDGVLDQFMQRCTEMEDAVMPTILERSATKERNRSRANQSLLTPAE